MIAYYDLACCPVSYDIVSFLMWVERIRLERGEPSVDIKILPGPAEGFRRDHMWPYSAAERRTILYGVVVPMCRLLPSCSSVEVLGKRVDAVPRSIGHGEYSISFKEFCTTYANSCRPLRIGGAVACSVKRVTITLRECEHWPERNSNLDEWLSAAKELAKLGYNMIIVRDTAQAEVPFEFDLGVISPATYPEASTDLAVRGLLYSEANLNLFINNGPAWFALALNVPTLIFRPITETTCWAHTAEAMKGFGVVKDQQMKGAPEHQRLVWLPETADNIVMEVRKFFK